MASSLADAFRFGSQSSPATSHALVLACCFAVTCQLTRVSINLVQTASAANKKHYESPGVAGRNNGSNANARGGSTNPTNQGTASGGNSNPNSASSSLREPLLGSDTTNEQEEESSVSHATVWSFRVQVLLLVVLVALMICVELKLKWSFIQVRVFPLALLWSITTVVAMGAWMTRGRGNAPPSLRTLLLCSALTLVVMCGVEVYYFMKYAGLNMDTVKTLMFSGDGILMAMVTKYALISIIEVSCVKDPDTSTGASDTDASTEGGDNAAPVPPSVPSLSRKALLSLLKPYVWPSATSESATVNRIRAIGTWVCVILSKVCNLTAPILLGSSATSLAHENYPETIRYAALYSLVGFAAAGFKEGQSLVYLKVAQAAFVQLSSTTFFHLHSLSLDWHLRKKLGEVIRNMDRGIAACDTLMKYLFLYLVPAIAECLVVCVIFATYFSYLPLAIIVFYFVWVYIVWTIVVTLWRKKFRKAVVESDNKWRDNLTDSLVNFDTVKYFSAEPYEQERFESAVQKYQAGSVAVQASLSFLNLSQKLLLQLCLAIALGLAAMGIQERIDCCVQEHGCESGLSDCCQRLSQHQCPGMQVGDFVAVLTYTLQLFAPLNFLGSVYNAVVMAIIDLTNLSEMLAEEPDVTDAPGALDLAAVSSAPGGRNGYVASGVAIAENNTDTEDDIAIEFDNVVFRYPTQPADKGLKGVSFKMKRGTTTAVVGPTGAGKTTISRLMFRFYDVLGGAVKVNGYDVRSLSQKSLRDAIGVVPQSTSMFNDTIRENMLYGRRGATEEEQIQAAQDAQLLDFIESLSEGWETMVGDRGLKLSGGEKQRLAIARCLLKDPPFVLLDEATSALDTLTENSVQEALDRLGSMRTVLVIAHRLGTVRNADNIVVLKDGVVAEQGTHDELLKLDGVYAEMWNMQLHSTSQTASQVDLAGTESEM